MIFTLNRFFFLLINFFLCTFWCTMLCTFWNTYFVHNLFLMYMFFFCCGKMKDETQHERTTTHYFRILFENEFCKLLWIVQWIGKHFTTSLAHENSRSHSHSRSRENKNSCKKFDKKSSWGLGFSISKCWMSNFESILYNY